MLDLHYVAGFFDGEGCITINQNQAGNISAEITIGNTNLDIITRLLEEFGGKLYTRPKQDKHKTVFIWRMYGRKAITFLTRIQEYLIIKKPMAELVISAYVMQDAGELTGNMREEVIVAARQLNHRGD